MKMKWFTLPSAALLLLAGGAASAQDMPPEAQSAGCTACHAIDKKVVGPAWAWVAHKYQGDADAKSKILDQMVNGGKGKWTDITGGVPMPPYGPRTDEATRDALADFILGLDPVAPPK